MGWLYEIQTNGKDALAVNEVMNLEELLSIENEKFVRIYEDLITEGMCVVKDVKDSNNLRQAVLLKGAPVQKYADASMELAKSTFLIGKAILDNGNGLPIITTSNTDIFCIFTDYMSARLFFERFPDNENPIGIENVILDKFNVARFENQLYSNRENEIALGVVKGSKIYIADRIIIESAHTIFFKDMCEEENILINVPKTWGTCRFNDFQVVPYRACSDILKCLIEEGIAKKLKSLYLDTNKILWAGVVCLRHKELEKMSLLLAVDPVDIGAEELIISEISDLVKGSIAELDLGYAVVDVANITGSFAKHTATTVVGKLTR